MITYAGPPPPGRTEDRLRRPIHDSTDHAGGRCTHREIPRKVLIETRAGTGGTLPVVSHQQVISPTLVWKKHMANDVGLISPPTLR